MICRSHSSNKRIVILSSKTTKHNFWHGRTMSTDLNLWMEGIWTWKCWNEINVERIESNHEEMLKRLFSIVLIGVKLKKCKLFRASILIRFCSFVRRSESLTRCHYHISSSRNMQHNLGDVQRKF